MNNKPKSKAETICVRVREGFKSRLARLAIKMSSDRRQLYTMSDALVEVMEKEFERRKL